ncbi:MAG: ATP-dependent DNA helicase [Desulfobacterales bacterium]
MKRKLTIAVRELVEFVCRSGDLVASFSGARRAVEAIRAHQKIQKSRPPTYRPEVTIGLQHETDAFLLSLSGRIDGVFSETGTDGATRTVIDEIKTTDRDLDQLTAEQNPLHWGQVKCYAYMVAVAQDLGQIDAQLTYYHFDSGVTREVRRSFNIGELAVFFGDLIERYLGWATILIDWQQHRDGSIRPLAFPFAGYRPGQRQMAVEVYRTIRSGGQLIVEAATGIGKTMAAVFPAVKALAEGQTAKVFYLTARTTARTAAETALAHLGGGGLRLKYLTLTAKDKICFNPENECSGEGCEFARGYYDRLRDALPEIFSRDAMDRPYIEEVARRYGLCPFELSLTLAVYADGIICDYNYAFDPRVYLRRFFLEGGGDHTFLIDEAHNLVDRSREMFSAEIFKQPFLNLRRQVKKALPRLYKSMGRVTSQMRRLQQTDSAAAPAWSDKNPPADLYPALRRFAQLAEEWLGRNEKAAFREALLELYFAVIAFTRVFETYDASYVTCYETLDSDFKIRLFCIDPSDQLTEALGRSRSAIFFSATMTPAAYFKKMFGCQPAAVHRHFPSPFAAENLGLFIYDRVSTYFKQRRSTAPAVIRAVAATIRRKKGNYLLFFPSYDYMRLIYEGFASAHPEVDTILQTPGMPESDRSTFLDRFSHDNAETLVGFAVMGGIFGEGIDLVGERLSGAVIVGVGLPGICLEKELIRDYYESAYGAGFEFAYMYPGINRVLQAAGRVIRSETDRGVVLLIDQRFGTARYHALFPSEWRPVAPCSENDLKNRLDRFWTKAGSHGG